MLTLPDLLRNQDLEFSCLGKKIEYKDFRPLMIQDFLYDHYKSIYLHEVAKFIANQEPAHLTIKGKKLEEFLSEPQHVSEIAGFLFTIFMTGTQNGNDIVSHVEVDLQKIQLKDPEYRSFDDNTGSHYNKLARHLPLFEKHWNLCLCQCWHGMAGGYEWPSNSKEFEEAFANNACWFLVGTGQQLQRYLGYSQAFKDFKEKIERNVSIFSTKPN